MGVWAMAAGQMSWGDGMPLVTASWTVETSCFQDSVFARAISSTWNPLPPILQLANSVTSQDSVMPFLTLSLPTKQVGSPHWCFPSTLAAGRSQLFPPVL